MAFESLSEVIRPSVWVHEEHDVSLPLPSTSTAKVVERIERAFFRLHQLLCLIERRAPRTDIKRAERSYHRSLQKIDVSERELVRHYPKYRFAMLARQAAARGCAAAVAEIPAEDLN